MLEACNKVNFNAKVAKVCLWDDTVWVFFEIILDQTPDVSTISGMSATMVRESMCRSVMSVVQFS